MRTIALVIVLGLAALACGEANDTAPDPGVPAEKTVMLEITGMT
jgi:hypothetical protein